MLISKQLSIWYPNVYGMQHQRGAHIQEAAKRRQADAHSVGAHLVHDSLDDLHVEQPSHRGYYCQATRWNASRRFHCHGDTGSATALRAAIYVKGSGEGHHRRTSTHLQGKARPVLDGPAILVSAPVHGALRAHHTPQHAAVRHALLGPLACQAWRQTLAGSTAKVHCKERWERNLQELVDEVPVVVGDFHAVEAGVPPIARRLPAGRTST